MRYWHPLTAEAVAAVKAWRPDEIVLLPLYPQFSTTTPASSLAAWHAEARRQGLACPTRAASLAIRPSRALSPRWPGMIDEQLADVGETGAAVADRAWLAAEDRADRRSLSGADRKHRGGGHRRARPARADWRVCYQSRVGPLEWLGPATDDEIRRAGQDGVARRRRADLVCLGAFGDLGRARPRLPPAGRELRRAGLRRVPTVGTDPRFIAGLARSGARAPDRDTASRCGRGQRRERSAWRRPIPG